MPVAQSGDDQPSAKNPDCLLIDNRVTRLIERCATPLFVFLALIYAASFNGQWRMGLDSANYRGLADSIASGRGYHFGEWAGRFIYPGYPALLAGLQKIFGRDVFSPVAPCAVMLMLSIMCMIVTYRLIRLHYPKWIAVTITFGVGTNAWYLQQTSDLMTDIPFLLGVMLALYGWDLLRMVRAMRARAAALMIIGLIIAASTRPTFLILVAAWGGACAIGLIFGGHPSRKFYAICLLILLGVWASMIAIDPRLKRFNPLAGGYEREAMQLIPGEQSSKLANFVHVINKQLPGGFFGEQLSLGSMKRSGVKYVPSAIFMSCVLIASVALIARRHPMWALLAWGTIGATVITSAEPRYYLMALPVLLIAYLMMLVKIASYLQPRWAEVVLCGGLALVTLNNFSAMVPFIKEQRMRPFLTHYREGEMLRLVALADSIREHVPAGESVIGPSGSIVSYLSGRHVYTGREIFPPRGSVQNYPQLVRDEKIKFAVFPAKWYRSKDPSIARMMERAVLRPGKAIDEIQGMRLAELRVVIPRGDWTRLPRVLPQDIRLIPHGQSIQPAK